MRPLIVLLSVIAVPAQAMAAELPRPVTPPSMTAWSMFENADWVVKTVMLVLIMASVATWAICLAKSLELRKSRRLLVEDLKKLESARLLADVSGLGSFAATTMTAAAMREASQAIDLSNPCSAEAMRERVGIRFGSIEARVLQAQQAGLSVLASIGATAPFVGLFGTVWGIMNSFIGISKAQTTNLAVVAPGIAEALLATAFGLVAAVPAVLIYNILARANATFRGKLREVSTQLACIVSHDIECAQLGKR